MYGAYIGRAIERAGLTPDAAGARIGVSGDAVRKWIRNTNPPSLGSLEKLAEAIGCLVGDLLPNSGGGFVADRFEPLAAALMGLNEEEIRDQILILASQASMTRNAILRRSVAKELRPVEQLTHSVTAAYNPAPTSGKADPVETFGVEGLTESGGKSDAASGRLGKATPPARKGKLAR